MQTGYRLSGKPPHIISLIILSAFASMGAVLMTPALPSIAEYFHISNGAAQLTVTSFLLGYALGQLLYGPIANRFGRKPAFYIGIGISTIGSLFSILSAPIESYHLLILGRLLEAFGSSVGLVVSYTIINDFYFPEQSRKIVAFMSLAFAIVPGFAVAVGGLLTEYVNWQSCFYFLLVYGLFLLYPAATLPETLSKVDLHALKPQHILRNYGRVFGCRKLIIFAAMMGFSTACCYLFCAEGPFIGIHVLSIAPGNYGLLALTPFIGSIIGSLCSAKLSGRYAAMAMVRTAIVIEAMAVIVMLVCFIMGWVNLFTLLIPMGFLLVGHALLLSNVVGLAMSQTEDKSNGSAVMNFGSMAIAVVMTFVLGMSHVTSVVILPGLFLLSLVLMVVAYVMLREPSIR